MLSALKNMGVGVVVAFFCLLGWAIFLRFCEREARASDELWDTVHEAIVELQPRWRNTGMAKQLTRAFLEAGDEHEIDPLLLVAVSMKESSLDPTTRTGRDRGLMQCREGGVCENFIPDDCDRELVSPVCQVRTGAGFLRFVKGVCARRAQEHGHPSPSWGAIVAAYGMKRCPTEDEAVKTRSYRRAKKFYDRIGGKSWGSPE